MTKHICLYTSLPQSSFFGRSLSSLRQANPLLLFQRMSATRGSTESCRPLTAQLQPSRKLCTSHNSSSVSFGQPSSKIVTSILHQFLSLFRWHSFLLREQSHYLRFTVPNKIILVLFLNAQTNGSRNVLAHPCIIERPHKLEHRSKFPPEFRPFFT